MTRLRIVSPILSAVVVLSWAPRALADNPLVQHVYTADPAPMVHGDTLYLYTSHDEDVTVNNFFTMNDWRLFSTKDAVNWTDHGSPLGYPSFSWATGQAWAPQCVERNGKFYLYVPVSNAIGVAVADTPYGPFVDAIGKPLVSSYQYIDPTVYVDDDGQAYLYFGNPKLWYVKLNEDMISYSGSIQQIANTTQSFGTRSGDVDRPTTYEEGPWFTRRGDLYYMLFAAGPLPEKISYSTATGPTGPWTYQGVIMDSGSGLAFTNHSGVADFKGHSFFFYHTQKLPGGGGYKRSVAVEEFSYGADGSIPKITPTDQGPEAVESLNPFLRVEGETMAWSRGIEVDGTSATDRYLSYIDDTDYVKLESVDFLTGALSFEASVASAGNGGTIELHLDSPTGPTIGTCAVPVTGGWQSWQSVSCDVDVDAAQGVHDLFLVFTGTGSLFNLDWWRFDPKDPLPTDTGGAPGAGGTVGAGGSASPAGSGGSPSGEAGSSAGGDSADDGTAADESGCACSNSGPHAGPTSSWLWASALLGLGLFARRLRRP